MNYLLCNNFSTIWFAFMMIGITEVDAPSAPGRASGAIVTILSSLRQILRQVELASNELEVTHGITQPQLACLRAIIAQGRLTQSDLSRIVHISPSTLVGVIDRLEDKQLVTRTRDRADRRRIFLAATVLGIEKARDAPESLHQRTQQALSRLDASELAGIEAALTRLVDIVDAAGIDAPAMLSSGPIPKPAEHEGRTG
jgi:DNA-binding MarR family transcriptional regulator